MANAVLLLLGLTMVAYALYAFLEAKNLESEAKGEQHEDEGHPQNSTRLLLHANDALSLLKTDAYLPFEILGGAGAFTILTAAVGLYSADSGSAACINLYALMLTLMLAAQGVAVYLIYNNKLEKPKDLVPHGKAEDMYNFLAKQRTVLEYLVVGVLGLQLLCVLLSCCLKAMKRDVEEDSDDEWGAPRRREPLLPSSSSPGGSPNTRKKKDDWSERMKEKYGLDTSKFRYSPPAGSDEEEEPAKRRCSIM